MDLTQVHITYNLKLTRMTITNLILRVFISTHLTSGSYTSMIFNQHLVTFNQVKESKVQRDYWNNICESNLVFTLPYLFLDLMVNV